MTLPANVPAFRHVPDSDRFLRGTSPIKVIKTDDHSVARNAQQIMHQTSGEVGYHYLGFDPEPIRMNKKPLRDPYVHTSTLKDHSQIFRPANNQDNNQSDNYGPCLKNRSMINSARDQLTTERSVNSNFSSTFQAYQTFPNPREKFAHTLNSLDASFDRQKRRDLYVASLPPKPMQELVGVATSNNHSAMQSMPWQLRLRKDI